MLLKGDRERREREMEREKLHVDFSHPQLPFHFSSTRRQLHEHDHTTRFLFFRVSVFPLHGLPLSPALRRRSSRQALIVFDLSISFTSLALFLPLQALPSRVRPISSQRCSLAMKVSFGILPFKGLQRCWFAREGIC